MKRCVLAFIARLATWMMHAAAGWVKAETPEFAMRMRRRTKKRILGEKAQAEATPTPVDDIAPTAADAYMGFMTMRAAQAKLGEALCVIQNYEVTGVLLQEQADVLRSWINDTIRILDEQEDQE